MTSSTKTNLSDEQTSHNDLDNTYFALEEIPKLDDLSSLTTVTPVTWKNTINYSDSDDISYTITSDAKNHNHTNIINDLVNRKINNHAEFVETTDEQIFSDDDNISHSYEYNEKIMSSTDTISLISSTTSSIHCNYCLMTLNEKQANRQRTINDNRNVNGDSMMIENKNSIEQLPMMNNDSDNDMEDEYEDDDNENFYSMKLFDDEHLDGIISDESQASNEIRYSSIALRNSGEIDDFNNISSTLHQQATSVTKIRYKKGGNWIYSSKSLDNLSSNSRRSFLSNNQLDGTDTDSVCLNSNINSTRPIEKTSEMLLQKKSTDCRKQENKNCEKLPYNFLQLNHDHHLKKNDETNGSLISKTITHDKDASLTNKKTNNFYLIHHQSSLIPIKDLLNKNINSNIEVIQMDEQNCRLEMVNGVLTLVRKDRSPSVSSIQSDEEKSEEQHKDSFNYQTSNNDDSPENDEGSSSSDSSISTPPLFEHEKDEERDEISSQSSHLLSNKEEAQEPFVLLRNADTKSSTLLTQNEQTVDLLDLFSTPMPVSNSNTNHNDKNIMNLLDDSLSSMSSYEHDDVNDKNTNDTKPDLKSDTSEKSKEISSSPIQNRSKSSSPSASIKDDIPSTLHSNNKTSVLTELVEKDIKSLQNDPAEVDYPIPKSEPPPVAKPINKARINEFASLLSSAVHLSQPPITKKAETSKINPTNNLPAPSPVRSDDHSFSSIASGTSDREERESYHTVKSNNSSEQEPTKRHIDARYNEKIDDRKSIQINTSNIKALFEQKISDTNRALAQSNDQLAHLNESRQQHKKVPVSYGSLKRHQPVSSQPIIPITNRRQSFQDSPNMNKYTDHVVGVKDVVIEDKQPEHGHQIQSYTRRNNTEQIIRPGVDSLTATVPSIPNGYYSESLIAREIRETKEKEEELKRQRKKCGLPEDTTTMLPTAKLDSKYSEPLLTKPPAKSSSFLSNLDFFTSKANNSQTDSTTSTRRSTITIHNTAIDTHNTSTNSDDNKQLPTVVSQELNRLHDNGVSVYRASSTNNIIHRSSSNQSISSIQSTNNIVQREIEAIRAKESELRQLGRIQHTSDEHSDPRKYQEIVSTLPKSSSVNTIPSGKVRRDSERSNAPLPAFSNAILRPKNINNNTSSLSSIRGKFPSPNPTAPIVSSSNKSINYSKLSLAERLEQEKREAREREQELKKQRHSLIGTTLSVNSTVTRESNNGSPAESDDDHGRYLEKVQLFKRQENERAHVPVVRPTKKLDLSQKWEQMIANRTTQSSTENDDN